MKLLKVSRKIISRCRSRFSCDPTIKGDSIAAKAAPTISAFIFLTLGASAKEDFQSSAIHFLQEHCYKCHDDKKQKGDIRLDTLSFDFENAEVAVMWQDVTDILKLGDMPPEEEPRPPIKEISALIDSIDVELRKAAETMQGGGRIAIRRLSHSALDNTVKDLLGIDQLLSANLPPDAEIDGFDSLAVTLDANPEMVLNLQDNAQKVAKHTIVSGDDVRSKRTYSLDTIGHGYNVEERGDLLVTASSRDRKYVMWPIDWVVPQDGTYRIRVKSFAHDLRTVLEEDGVDYEYLDSSYQRNMKTRDRLPNDQPRLVSIVSIKASEARHMDAASVPGRRVGHFYTGGEMQNDEVVVRLDKGENIMIHYASAAVINRSPKAKVGDEERNVADLLYVKEIEVEGPLIGSWPPKAHQDLLAANSNQPVEQRIESFLFKAFRRPVPQNTVDSFLTLYDMGLSRGFTPEESMRNVVEGVLVSPRFLFNYDSGEGNDVWALASRLSFFLWNSIPDEELLKLAESGELLKPRVIKKQVLRMLGDPKAERFVHEFTGQWLGLKHIELMKPDPKLYPDYDPLLEELMRDESEAFFQRILTKNLPVSNFLDSKFVMINERLAAHYGIDGVKGDHFRPVKLPKHLPRGGLLGQASVLKITSNGTRTSPVIRGVWILEKLLGSPPSPPPPDVEPIEPDVRGSTTIPEMLAKHREVPTCYDCHQKIDPWGLSLEHYDAVGKFRDLYRNKQPIDARGSIPGHKFDGAEEMKQVLLDRTDQFTRALTEKLFTYGLGHPLTFREKLAADDIAEANFKNKDGFKELIVDICTSPLFRGELGGNDLAQN